MTKIEKELLVRTADIPLSAYLNHRALGIPLDEIFAFYEELSRVERSAEKFYRTVEWPKVLEQVSGLRSEIPEKERNEMRRVYLSTSIAELKSEYIKNHDPLIAKKLKKLYLEAKIHLGLIAAITPEQIVSAREYPITELIENKNLYAICPFHKEKTPSLYLKNNFYYCYGCGKTGDSIDLCMELHGVSFKRAVEKLSTLPKNS